MGAFPREQVLLGEAGDGSEMHAAEVRYLSRRPTGQSVAAGHRFDHPGVDREGFEVAETKKRHAVGDFFAYTGQGAERSFGFEVGQRGGLFQPAGMGHQKLSGAFDVAGPKSELAGSQLFLRNGRQLLPRGQGVEGKFVIY